jgi:hypothetical protein
MSFLRPRRAPKEDWASPPNAKLREKAHLNGAPEEIRTPDPQIRSLVLRTCSVDQAGSPGAISQKRKLTKIRHWRPFCKGTLSLSTALPGWGGRFEPPYDRCIPLRDSSSNNLAQN